MREIREKKPDLVIADISLSGTSGIDLIKNIRAEFEDLPVLVVSMHEESLYAERALHAGAKGYIMKQEASKRVVSAIRKIRAGEVYLSDALSARMLHKRIGKTGASSHLLSMRYGDITNYWQLWHSRRLDPFRASVLTGYSILKFVAMLLLGPMGHYALKQKVESLLQ